MPESEKPTYWLIDMNCEELVGDSAGYATLDEAKSAGEDISGGFGDLVVVVKSIGRFVPRTSTEFVAEAD